MNEFEHSRIISSLLSVLDKTRTEFRAAIDGIPSTSVIYTESGWTIKDIVAHVTAWEEELITGLTMFAKGQPHIVIFTEEDNETFNQREYVARREYPITQVMDEFDQTRNSLKALINSMTVDQWGIEFIPPWGGRRAIERAVIGIAAHEDEHRDDILKVRPTIKL